MINLTEANNTITQLLILFWHNFLQFTLPLYQIQSLKYGLIYFYLKSIPVIVLGFIAISFPLPIPYALLATIFLLVDQKLFSLLMPVIFCWVSLTTVPRDVRL